MSDNDVLLQAILDLKQDVGAMKASLSVHMNAEETTLGEIKDHVALTNGRVTALETTDWKRKGVVGFIYFVLAGLGAWFGIHH